MKSFYSNSPIESVSPFPLLLPALRFPRLAQVGFRPSPRPRPLPLPVGAEGSESEDGHPHGGELDHRDEFAAHLPEHPLVEEVARGVHRDAGKQQQHVPSGQVRDEDVGDAPHGAVADEDLHQHDVAQQAHGDDEQVDGRDHTADHQVGSAPVPGGWEVPLRHAGNEPAPIPARGLGEVGKRLGWHGRFSRRVRGSFRAARCPEECKSPLGCTDFPFARTSVRPARIGSHRLVPRKTRRLRSGRALQPFTFRRGALVPAGSELKKKKKKSKAVESLFQSSMDCPRF